MIFYFEEQNIFSFQILVFKGHTGVFFAFDLKWFDLQLVPNSLL